ncbi:hypothetical protein CW751_08300 [Brumimicrobium salinarum]|uniref:Putative auto-transporter adhesin head GIN domain-containing protein n=1 Tax=Brumimicrobium salinarum TaxID=2058658 RepID=A0A2I0R2F7_9FLAO|nr:DUF2807 domain-containing protein [Brumimicrobium salinarum]PKR80762.1 hypothetical protein CW751_08300 [Brumimicrobium salinarum]
MLKKSSILLVFTFVFFACKKAEDRACFKGKGDDASLEYVLPIQVDSLMLYDNLFYTLIDSDEHKVVLKGGDNLLKHIDVQVGDKKLTLRNKNKCSFLRSFKNEIHAYIYVDTVRSIHYEGSKQLLSKDTLFSNELRLMITDGAGDVNLILKNSYTSAVITHGFGNFKLSGYTNAAFLHCNTNSYCDTRKLKVTHGLNVISNTVSNMLINANSHSFKAEIYESGNIKYVGNPGTVSFSKYGKGNLIDLNN